MIDAKKRSHAIGRLIRHADERAAEHIPVEADELVEVPDGNADVAERPRSHSFSLLSFSRAHFRKSRRNCMKVPVVRHQTQAEMPDSTAPVASAPVIALRPLSLPSGIKAAPTAIRHSASQNAGSLAILIMARACWMSSAVFRS